MHTKIHLMSGKTIYISKVTSHVYIGIGTNKEIPKLEDMVRVASFEIEDVIEALKLHDKLR